LARFLWCLLLLLLFSANTILLFILIFLIC
jgi:hypothetical protein